MILDTTLKTVEIVLASAKTTNDCEYTVDYADTNSGTSFVPAGSMGLTNGTSAVTAVPAPTGVQRHVKALTVYNADTVNSTVTVRMYDGTNRRIIIKVTLLPAQSLIYMSEVGWSVPTFTIPRSYFKVYMNSTQGSISTTGVKINFDTVEIDPLNYWDATNHRWTPQVAGRYHVTASCDILVSSTISAAQPLLVLSIKKSGSVVADVDYPIVSALSSGTMEPIVPISADVSLNGSTDYLELFVSVGNGGGSGTIEPGLSRTFLSANYVGAL